MPSEESRDKIIRLNVYNMKVIGYPVVIRRLFMFLTNRTKLLGNEKYQRDVYIFNLCFVVDKHETEEDAVFDPIVQKFSEYLINLEKEESFLTKRVEELPAIMKRVFEDLNTAGRS